MVTRLEVLPEEVLREVDRGGEAYHDGRLLRLKRGRRGDGLAVAPVLGNGADVVDDAL